MGSELDEFMRSRAIHKLQTFALFKERYGSHESGEIRHFMDFRMRDVYGPDYTIENMRDDIIARISAHYE